MFIDSHVISGGWTATIRSPSVGPSGASRDFLPDDLRPCAAPGCESVVLVQAAPERDETPTCWIWPGRTI